MIRGKHASFVFAAVVLVICIAVISTFSDAEKPVFPKNNGLPVVLKSENKIPKAAVEYAEEYIRRSAEGYNSMWKNNGFPLSVIEAELMMTSIRTGTASENISIQMYEVGFRMKLEGDAEQYHGARIEYEEENEVYWMTGYSNTNVIYIVLSCEEKNGEEIWTRLGMIIPEDLELYYGTEEMQEKYGNMYTAAAMELYNRANGICYADLDHDGVQEHLYVVDTGDGMVYELVVENADREVLWSETAGTMHTGWNSLFLCQVEGKDYLLRYNPTTFTGMAAYDYTLFTLENGAEKIWKQNGIGFMIADITEITPEMELFAEEVNQLLEHSEVLLSTEEGNVVIGPAPAYPYLERYDFLN